MLYGIVAATTALLLTAVLAALLREPALRLGLTDRRQRQRRVPLFGGVAVVLGTCLVAVAGDRTGIAPLGDGIGVLLVAGAAVAGLGLIADVWRLKARFLVIGTAVAAACVVPYGDTGAVAGAAGVGWITFVALAFRSLDHADGVAGTVGVVTAFGVGACAAAEVMDGLAVLLSVLAAALTGFLMHNWPPARVALGACGSLFAGFLLAAASLLARAGHDAVAGAGVLFALTAVAVADAVLVAASRRLAGRPQLRGGPDHLAHRLRRLGLTPQGATVLIGVAAFAGVLVGVLVHTGWAGAQALLWVAGGALVVVLGLLRVAVYGPKPPRARGRRGGGTGGGTGGGGGLRARVSPQPPATGPRGPEAEAPGRAPAGDFPRAAAEGPRRAPVGDLRRTAEGGLRRAAEGGPLRAPAGGLRRTATEATPRPPVYAPRRQPEVDVRPPESGVRRVGRFVSAQVSAGLRVRNG
ncbi:undecaprenyl/decaprenyl-phosphate alpha-N-acetylglucosaminyl 1-phosphate transferase [Streptomyces sp. NBC_01275]|uniref:MraY family glycosyltransferase n=1 Tax=Streptomyces sp. NBC_01275 TaxID=2903807 RepID=UPI002253D717|nr:undecaprenyl/decaprenyl-phosphate alpha-N-acetylglucosaminyl 1-phosphate transferase [Streptomyces sp. NBC_01275]MCX4763707.1 undecaprenyl/decaprenyl-phosphate alpha-N-acetylglucosaminyl 1-phosphate transferase [Streptomyces sp. NBC_01275]